MTEFELNYQTGTGASYSCSFVQNGKMYIVGGWYSDINKQISIVEECELRLVGQFPNIFQYGACNNFINPDGNQQALLCSGEDDKDGCIRYENI